MKFEKQLQNYKKPSRKQQKNYLWLNFLAYKNLRTLHNKSRQKSHKKSRENFVGSKNMSTFASQSGKTPLVTNAKIAQLVEHDLAKVGVAGSSPVFRSKENFEKMVGDS